MTLPTSSSPKDETPYISKVWVADNDNGTYKNPILYADYSDPDVIRVGNDYYLTASSFTSFPALPILHSKDLVNWTIIGHAVQQYPDKLFDRPQHGKGIWAPAIRYHNNSFYIFWGDPDTGIYMVKAKNPKGPWCDPKLVLPGKGLIDPCPFWDDNDKAYIVHAWAGSRTGGFNSVLTIRELNLEGTEVSSQGRHVFDGHDKHPTIEGPKLYKRNGYYYIFAPAGGVKQGWQTVLRSKDIFGPYEDKIVLAQGSTQINGPHQGGWIDTPSGQHWFIHFQDAEAYGRIMHLQPVTWTNDWPIIGVDKDGDGKGKPVLNFEKPDIKGDFAIITPVESDEFNTDSLGLQWQWQANPKKTWYAMQRDTECLRLFPDKLPHEKANLWDAGNVLSQKFPAPDFTATTKVKFCPQGDDERSGLVIIGADYACLSIMKTSSSFSLAQIICKNAQKDSTETIIEEVSLPGNSAYLRVKVASPKGSCQFSYSLDGKQFNNIGKLFQAKAGRWIGAKVGLFCVCEFDAKKGGYADFDWFRID